MADILGIKVNIGNDPKVAARMALGFRKAALISALEMIETAIEDLEENLWGVETGEEVDRINDEIRSLKEDAKEIEDELDSTAWDGNDKKEA